MFGRCHRSWAAATPVKYKGDIQMLTFALTMIENAQINGTGEIGLISSTPSHLLQYASELAPFYGVPVKQSWRICIIL